MGSLCSGFQSTNGLTDIIFYPTTYRRTYLNLSKKNSRAKEDPRELRLNIISTMRLFLYRIIITHASPLSCLTVYVHSHVTHFQY